MENIVDKYMSFDIHKITGSLSEEEIRNLNSIMNKDAMKNLENYKRDLISITEAEPMIVPITNLPCYYISPSALEAINVAIKLFDEKIKLIRAEEVKSEWNNNSDNDKNN